MLVPDVMEALRWEEVGIYLRLEVSRVL